MEGQDDVPADGTETRRLPMRTKGIGFVFSCFLIYAGIAAIGVGGSVAFLLRAFTTTPGECEAGWVGGVGLSTSFLAVGYIFGSIAFRGLRASVIANRHVGGVEIHRDLLVIDSPGVLATPAIVHRDWISTIDTAESRTLAAGALLTLCYQSRFTDIRFVALLTLVWVGDRRDRCVGGAEAALVGCA